MTYTFGKRSRGCLGTVDLQLAATATRALEYGVMDFGVIYGHRNKTIQNNLYRKGYSKVQFPDSKHNAMPSLAVDLNPYVPSIGLITGNPTQIKSIAKKYKKSQRWANQQVFALYGQMAGLMLAAGKSLGFDVGWGNDWDADGNVFDTNFVDLGHFFIRD